MPLSAMGMRQSTNETALASTQLPPTSGQSFQSTSLHQKTAFNSFCQHLLDRTDQGYALQCRREQGALLHMDFTRSHCFPGGLTALSPFSLICG